MFGALWRGVRRFILWDYPRASWQYDVMVALILGFIFLTPRQWFRDQPRPASIVMIEGHDGNDVWLAPELLEDVAEQERLAKVTALVQGRFGKSVSVVRVEPILDAESEIRGYIAQVRP